MPFRADGPGHAERHGGRSLQLCPIREVFALTFLKAMSTLTELDLTGTKVTASGVAKLKEALPNCKTVWDGSNAP